MASYKDLIHSETKKLGEYLKLESNNTFLIPFSQRNYEWGKTEVTRLFNDLSSLYNGEQKYHMLNFFTLYRDTDDNLRIFDGQQRTVTCMLILAVIAQRLYAQNSSDAAQQIHKDYFAKTDALRPNKEDQKKLIFDSSEDNSFFYQVTDIDSNFKRNLEQSNIINPNNNQRAIFNNIKHIDTLLDEFIEVNEDVNLRTLVTSIIDNTLLVEFDANEEEVALSMFESLNNTGKNIEKYYVLKNDMVKCLGETSVKPRWREIDSNLTGLNHNAFLNAAATLKRGKTTTASVLDHLYSNKDDPTSMKDLLEFLYKSSVSFLQICNPSQMTRSKENRKNVSVYQAYTDQIRLFGMKQHRPIILAMLLTHKPLTEINKILKAVVTLTVKNFFFNEQKANTIEKKFADYANQMYLGQLTTEALLHDIYDLCVDNEQLKASIIRKKITTPNAKIAFILRKAYNYSYRNNELEVSASSNDVEHILPINPSKGSQWLTWFPDEAEREKYTLNIGNLTLWLNKDNRSAKNAEFANKQEKYMTSGLDENQRIAEEKQWTSQEIKKRADRVADQIVAAFGEN
ncbi:DUF262 domain-containing protein [Lactiplantibacillus pentosus]|uniref:DUF1524 domain-containing protein n=1 Tax=Lactiplantibacillus pentosus TaxID=1589 RepID=A0A3M6LB56_LACPE|nr:DUF1524 domain-containing protein [Lactiplantibacillus pentosus]AYG38788.1 DUF262 domain-containing protein [Lactiplantibacillus pentosus]AYG41448.1 DUF262 domain-containing protein [Lactiplantibacillus pentosus]MBU7472737.1 DUF262 domain-containing protein [Lactiplantibacillus pentosus]MBU7527995.1 DUF262 domain-containing protein [Lactiplantibacillus pentosus]MCJ8181004.1 DUF262 domain-containing HNH endonuclease family protein [Lactiplantibacillus pentosus]